jgi:hypothetical protein
VQEHLRGTIAKSYLNLADIYLDRGGTENLHVAEDYCLRGLQIASVLGNNPLEAVHLKLLSELMKRQGKSKEDIEGVSTKLHRIEGPARERFLAEALTRPEDQDSLYFTISALKHGLGYELQRVNVVVHPMGPAELEGIFTLRAMSMLAVIDAYLMTVPEGQAGVHFVGVESLTPEYTLSHRRHAREKSERIEIDINPVMRPGDILTYRWTARASEGAFATTTEQLTTAGLEFEHIALQIIAPMRRLEIHATIPQQGENPLPCWFELWRMGPVPKPDTSSFALAAQTAYRALLKDESGAVQCDQELLPPDRRKLHLVVNYPWLAMRYVLAWKVE